MHKYVGKIFGVHVDYFSEGRTLVKEVKILLSSENEIKPKQVKRGAVPENIVTLKDLVVVEDTVVDAIDEIVKTQSILSKRLDKIEKKIDGGFAALSSTERYTQQTASAILSEWRGITNGESKEEL